MDYWWTSFLGSVANAVSDLLGNRERADSLGRAARESILADYSLERCVPRQLQLIQLAADRVLQASPDGHRGWHSAHKIHQLFVSPLLDDPSLMHHHDAVGVSDSAETVGDENTVSLS